MEKIESLRISRLPLYIYIAFHHSFLEAAEAAGFDNEAWRELLAAYKAEFEGIGPAADRPRASPLTRPIREADHRRDQTLRQLVLMADAAARSSVEAERQAGVNLQLILHPYRGTAREDLASETQRIRGLAETLTEDAESLSWLDAIGALGVLERLNDENEAFDTLYVRRAIEWRLRPGAGVNTRAQRRELDRAWYVMVGLVNDTAGAASAGGVAGFDTERLASFIARANALVLQYRLVLANEGKARPDDKIRLGAALRRMIRYRQLYEKARSEHGKLVEARYEAARAEAAKIVADNEERIARALRPLTERNGE